MRKLVENSSEREDTEDLFQAGPNRTLICEGFERMRNAKTLDTDVRPADPTYTWSEISSWTLNLSTIDTSFLFFFPSLSRSHSSTVY